MLTVPGGQQKRVHNAQKTAGQTDGRAVKRQRNHHSVCSLCACRMCVTVVGCWCTHGCCCCCWLLVFILPLTSTSLHYLSGAAVCRTVTSRDHHANLSRCKMHKFRCKTLQFSALMWRRVFYFTAPSLRRVSFHSVIVLVRPMGQYCFAGWRLSSSVVCNTACMRTDRPAMHREHGRPARRRPGAWAVGRPTLHGGPVRLRPVRATPCF